MRSINLTVNLNLNFARSLKVLLIGQLEDMEPYVKSNDEVRQQMTCCWNSSFHVSVDDAELYVNNSCDRHQLSLMAWLYDEAVSTYAVNYLSIHDSNSSQLSWPSCSYKLIKMLCVSVN